MSDDEKAFLQAILDNPEDEAIRLIYADWLDEHDRDTQANWLRIESFAQGKLREGLDCSNEFEQMRELFAKIDPQWRGLVSRGKIENCRVYNKACPQVWQTLEKPNLFDEDAERNHLTRRCEICEREVHLTTSQTEAQARLWVDQLVIVPVCLVLHGDDLEPDSAAMTIGMQALDQRRGHTPSIGRKMQQRARRRLDN